MIKIKLECWWTNSKDITNRFIKQFVPDVDFKNYEFVESNPDYTIVFGRTEWGGIETPKERTFYFSQEPLWSPNEPKTDISNFCSRIFIADKRMYEDKPEYEEGLFPMFYGGRGEGDSNELYDWNCDIKNQTLLKDKAVSIIVRRDYSSHYNSLENPEIFKINYQKRTDLGIEISKNKNIDIYGTFWDNNGSNLHGEVWNKRVALNEHRFSVGCENTIQKNYISEKFWDIVLTDTVPIYLGCSNINEYIPQECFISLNNLTIEEMANKINGIYDENEYLYTKYIDSVKYLKNEFFTNPNFNLWVKIKSIIE